MYRIALALPFLLLAGCAGCTGCSGCTVTGLFAPPPPDTPAEAVYREQLGVLKGTLQTVESVRDAGTAAAAVEKLKGYKEVMTDLQTKRLALDPNDREGDNDGLRSAYASLIRQLTQAKLDLHLRGGTGGYHPAATEVTDAANAVMDQMKGE
jgi:hypothetical protein